MCCAAVALPATGQNVGTSPADPLLTPRRLTRTVALIDGHDLQFKRLTADGLSHTRVAQIVQDDQGFIWFGTQRGLHRYDGHALQLFHHDSRQQKSLSGVYVHSLLAGHAHTLWVGSDNFLDRFDSETETFTRQPITPVGQQQEPINITSMRQDSTGILWLGTRSGLYRFDPATQRTTVLRSLPGDPASLASDAILFVGEDARDGRWVGTAAGFDLLDRSSRHVVSHLAGTGSPSGMAIHEDRFGVLWIIHGTDGQLAVWNRSANILATWRPTLPGAGVDPVMFSAMLEDREGTMWFGTLNHGILKFDRSHDRLVRYTSDPSDPHSLSDRRVNVLYQDREGLLWAGLHQSEPNFFLPSPPSFQNIQIAGRLSTMVSAIHRSHAGPVWLGLDRGVRLLDRDTWMAHDVPGLEGDETTSVAESAPGVFWAGTGGQGLRQYDRRTGRVKRFRHDPERAGSLPSDFVEQVKLDRNGAVWAVTWRGLARWEPETAQFVTILPTGAPQDLTLHTATFAQDGIIWIGSNLGLYRFDPTTRAVQWFRHDDGDERSLSNDRVNSIHEAADGSIWIGTQAGLDHWDPAGKALRGYTRDDGLPGIGVSCILEDDAQRLWMSTDRGIARLVPATGQVTVYGTADGLPGVNLTGWDSCERTATGEMFFAGFAGAVAFFPTRVIERDYVPPVELTRFRLLDATFEVDGTRRSAIPLGHRSEIRLGPAQTRFSIEFAALSFLSPETNRLRYRLQGLQEEWTTVRSDQSAATYLGVVPGTYAFQVQGATANGPWSPSAAALSIVILPPWWASWPFYLVVGLAVTALLFTAYRLRVRQLRHAYNVRLEERWAERSRIARELHDTLLQGFQGLMFRLQAVRELLPAQPAKAIPVLGIALVKGEEAIDEARSAVSDLRSSGKIDRDFAAGLTGLAAAAAHRSIGGVTPSWDLVTKGRVREIPRPVLYELYQVAREAISNAFQHAQANHVTVEVRYDADRLRIAVVDDGVGFDEALLVSERSPGHFGVPGMIERIERLGGETTLRSQPREGTRVRFSVPAAVAYRKDSASGRLGSLLSWRARPGPANGD